MGYSVANVVSDKKTANILEYFGLARKIFMFFIMVQVNQKENGLPKDG